MIERPQGRALPVGMAFRAQVLGEGSAMVLSVTGELDVAARAQMDDALEKACAEPGEHLTVDVSGLSFMDASGLSLLVAAHNRLVRDGRGGVVVKGASGIVRRVFEITELTSLLDERPAPGGSPAALAPQERPEWPEWPDLERAREESGLALRELFVAYFGLGGTADVGEIAAHLGGAPLDRHQHDVVVHALNERFIDLGRRERLLAYAGDR